MAATTTLISKSAFTPYADISSYIANAYPDRYILQAQRNHVRPILGDATYDALQAAVAASTESADDLALLAKITPVLVYRAMQLYCPFSKVYFTNMGARVLSDEQSREATDTEIQKVAERCEIQANIYTAELWKWLDDNKVTYTVWRDDTQRWQKNKGISGIGVVRRKDLKDRSVRTYERDF